MCLASFYSWFFGGLGLSVCCCSGLRKVVNSSTERKVEEGGVIFLWWGRPLQTGLMEKWSLNSERGVEVEGNFLDLC